MKVGNTVLVWIILYFTVTMYKKGGWGGKEFYCQYTIESKKMGAKLFWQAYLNAPDRTGTHL